LTGHPSFTPRGAAAGTLHPVAPSIHPVSKRWFYLHDDQAHGPFAESEIRARLRRAELPAQVRGWHDGADGWLPLAGMLVESARQSGRSGAHARAGWHDTSPHPVRRYLARLVDIGAFGLLAMSALFLLLYALAPETGMRFTHALGSTPGRALYMLLTLLLGSLLAAIPLGLTGSTPGKWLFGIRVVDSDGHPIGVALALRREMRVWLQGLALGLPVVSLVSLGLAYRRLVRRGRTRWDETLDLQVRHRPLGPAQSLLAALGLLAVAMLFVVQRG
jgi:uncharacterized RDD family membrane protein YckC